MCACRGGVCDAPLPCVRLCFRTTDMVSLVSFFDPTSYRIVYCSTTSIPTKFCSRPSIHRGLCSRDDICYLQLSYSASLHRASFGGSRDVSRVRTAAVLATYNGNDSRENTQTQLRTTLAGDQTSLKYLHLRHYWRTPGTTVPRRIPLLTVSLSLLSSQLQRSMRITGVRTITQKDTGVSLAHSSK